MNVVKATERFEQWVAARTPLLAEDVRSKHAQMASRPFPFLRATYYRWAQRWPGVCEALADAPPVPAVGDLHVENFGTWRDAEGRLVWGVNDFDEAAKLPWPNDLVRLAVSAILAVRGDRLSVPAGTSAVPSSTGTAPACAPEPFVLGERHVVADGHGGQRVTQPG